MRYALYEDPQAHKFAFVPLPDRFAEEDALPSVETARWFDSHAEAIAALSELLDREEGSAGAEPDDAARVFAPGSRHFH